MNEAKRFWYRGLTRALRCYQKAFWDFRVYGRERIPPGPKIFVSNHITSVDHFWIMLALPEPVHMVVGPGYAPAALARILDYFEQINARPAQRGTVVENACRYLSTGESVFITPEGDLQPTLQLGRFFTGVAKIYRRSRVPIVPIALLTPRSRIRRHPKWDLRADDRVFPMAMVWRGPVCVNIGEAFTPSLPNDPNNTDEDQRITDNTRDRVAALAEEARTHRFWLDLR